MPQPADQRPESPGESSLHDPDRSARLDALNVSTKKGVPMSEITKQDGTTMHYQDGAKKIDKDLGTGAGQLSPAHARVLQAIGRQVSAKRRALHQTLAMPAYCGLHKFGGAAGWLKQQSVEERQHALRLLDFVLARNAAVELEALPAPTHEFKNITDVFLAALVQEEKTTAQIHELYELATASKAFPEMAELQWFVTEQVEEEHTARLLVSRFQLVANDPGSLLDLDRELGARLTATTTA